jgi:hypothetical protein
MQESYSTIKCSLVCIKMNNSIMKETKTQKIKNNMFFNNNMYNLILICF